MACVVSPVGDHKNESTGAAVKMTESPAQKLVGPLAVMIAVGTELTVTVSGADAPPQPVVSVVTKYVPAAVTVMACVVSPPGDQE